MTWIDFSMNVICVGFGCLGGAFVGYYLCKGADCWGGEIYRGEGLVVNKMYTEGRKTTIRIPSGNIIVPTPRDIPAKRRLIVEVEGRIESIDVGTALYGKAGLGSKVEFSYSIGPLSGKLFVYRGTVKLQQKGDDEDA